MVDFLTNRPMLIKPLIINHPLLGEYGQVSAYNPEETKVNTFIGKLLEVMIVFIL